MVELNSSIGLEMPKTNYEQQQNPHRILANCPTFKRPVLARATIGVSTTID